MSHTCWIRSAKGLHGPYNPDLLHRLAESSLLKPEMEISFDRETWHRAGDMPGLFDDIDTGNIAASLAAAAITATDRPAAARPSRAKPLPAKSAPDPRTTANAANTTDAIDLRIQALPVSDNWKRRFRELQANPSKISFNWLAGLLGPIYYIAKGVWKKGLTLTVWLSLLFLVADIVAAALGHSIPWLVGTAVTVMVLGQHANRDIWRKQVHGETFWPQPATRWGVWLGVPAWIAAMVLVSAFPPYWLALPSCDDPIAKHDLLGMLREDGPVEFDDQPWQAFKLADIVTLNRKPFPQFRHCHASLHLRSASGEEHSYSIEYWLGFNTEGDLHLTIN